MLRTLTSVSAAVLLLDPSTVRKLQKTLLWLLCFTMVPCGVKTVEFSIYTDQKEVTTVITKGILHSKYPKLFDQMIFHRSPLSSLSGDFRRIASFLWWKAFVSS